MSRNRTPAIRDDLRVASAIVQRLFTSGNHEEAHRLVLTAVDGRDLGGWCKQAVVDVIVDVLLAERERAAAGEK